MEVHHQIGPKKKPEPEKLSVRSSRVVDYVAVGPDTEVQAVNLVLEERKEAAKKALENAEAGTKSPQQ